LPLIVERLSKQPFNTFVHNEIFAPLDIKQSLVMQGRGVVIPHRAVGYRKSKGGWQVTTLDTPACGDGNVFSNLEDLAKWLAALDQPEFTSADTWQKAFQPAKLDDGTQIGYGFGWFLQNHAGKPVQLHTGTWNGTRTFIGRWPQEKLSILILCNREDRNPQEIAMKVADAILLSAEKN
jgi:CubicO group peptidase (beta-lactamase class C family)